MTGQWEPSRRQRRVLLALLAGLPHMSGYPIARLAQVGAGTVYPVLATLERRGWVLAQLDAAAMPGGGRRRFYTLTPAGREAVIALLGMEAP